MHLTQQPIREIHAARYSNDGTRLVTLDRYVTGWDLPSLKRLYRVRPMHELSRLAFQPGGDLMLSRHGHGMFALMDSRSGAVLATCGNRRFGQANSLALSRCGNFVIEGLWQEWNVREISSNTVVWKHPGTAYGIVPLNDGLEWAVFYNEHVEVWRWPFAQAPRQTIQLPGPVRGIPVVAGSLAAWSAYKEICVLDLSDGRHLFSVPLGQLGEAHWSHDGSLIVVKSKEPALEVYSRDGKLTRAVATPGLSLYGHSFSAAADDAALVYYDGVVLIRDFRRFLDGVDGLPEPWTPREPRAFRSEHPLLHFEEPSTHTVLECTTPKELEVALEGFQRPTWKPVLRAERGPVDGSKFGGVPWLAPSEDWPQCGQCDSRMDLFLQLNSADLPAECGTPFEGLLQVFVCTHTTYRSGLCMSADPFSNASSVRVLRDWSGTPQYTEPPEADLFEEERIVGWTRHDDFPDSEELALTGTQLDERGRHLQIDQEFPFPVAGDKLLGWADWEQGVGLVACPRCGEAMRILFQIDSCCGVPVMLADGGRGWVSQCSRHPDVVTFSWTCG